MLSDANIALLFLRYRREFSLPEHEGRQLTKHYHSFASNVRKLANFITTQAAGRSSFWERDQPIDRGMNLGITEHTHISSDDWIQAISSALRQIEIVIGGRHARSNLLPASPIDLRSEGLITEYVSEVAIDTPHQPYQLNAFSPVCLRIDADEQVINIIRRPPAWGDSANVASMILAKAQLIDALFLRRHNATALPRGGTAHIVLSGHDALRRALAGRGPDPATGSFVSEPFLFGGGGGGSAVEMGTYRHVPPDDAGGDGGECTR